MNRAKYRPAHSREAQKSREVSRRDPSCGCSWEDFQEEAWGGVGHVGLGNE